MYMSIKIINQLSPKIWSWLICVSPVKWLLNDLVWREQKKKVTSNFRMQAVEVTGGSVLKDHTYTRVGNKRVHYC